MRVIETSAGENLAAFSRFLWQHRVAHRIFEERGQQIVELADPALAPEVREAFSAWQAGRLDLQSTMSGAARLPSGRSRVGQMLRSCPGVVAVLLVSLAIFPFALGLSEGRPGLLILALTIVDLRTHQSVELSTLFSDLEIWRWLTPIFVHFSVTHIAFNSVVVFDLGRRVESVQGTLQVLAVVVVVGVLSNLGQVVMNTHPVFGGLSGVAYGLLGYLLVMGKRFPEDSNWQLPPGLAIGLLVFLVVFSTGITEPFGLHVANAAHWTGLAAGAAVAAVTKSKSQGVADAHG